MRQIESIGGVPIYVRGSKYPDARKGIEHMDKRQIAIQPSTEQDMLLFEDAFLGRLKYVAPAKASDDFLYATLLGWHLRQISKYPEGISNFVFTEFAFRRANAAGGFHDDENSFPRFNAQGVRSTEGNTLTVEGINSESLFDIGLRAVRVQRMIEELEAHLEIAEAFRNYDAIWSRVANYTDQAIIDFGIWAMLQTCSEQPIRGDNYPFEFEKEIQKRALR